MKLREYQELQVGIAAEHERHCRGALKPIRGYRDDYGGMVLQVCEDCQTEVEMQWPAGPTPKDSYSIAVEWGPRIETRASS